MWLSDDHYVSKRNLFTGTQSETYMLFFSGGVPPEGGLYDDHVHCHYEGAGCTFHVSCVMILRVWYSLCR